MEDRAILKVEDLSKNFGGVAAIVNVSFHLRTGELLGVIGPNGSGKTTLVNLLTGFVRPDSGKVLYRDTAITGKMPYKIAALGIARTFQMVKPFYQLSAFKNLIIPLYSSRVKKLLGGRYGDRDAVAIDLLEDVGFERDSFVPYKVASSLPHGYLKRLELARCLALRPDLLILDDSFRDVDVRGCQHVAHHRKAEPGRPEHHHGGTSIKGTLPDLPSGHGPQLRGKGRRWSSPGSHGE